MHPVGQRAVVCFHRRARRRFEHWGISPRLGPPYFTATVAVTGLVTPPTVIATGWSPDGVLGES